MIKNAEEARAKAERERADICRFCSGDIRYHDYDDYVKCKEKELAEFKEQLHIAVARAEALVEALEQNQKAWSETSSVPLSDINERIAPRMIRLNQETAAKVKESR